MCVYLTPYSVSVDNPNSGVDGTNSGVDGTNSGVDNTDGGETMTKQQSAQNGDIESSGEQPTSASYLVKTGVFAYSKTKENGVDGM